jgi:hypothetical protein
MNEGKIIFSLFSDLEWALSNEMDLVGVPSSHLTDAVEEWANKLHALGFLDADDKETTDGLVAEARERIEEYNV